MTVKKKAVIISVVLTGICYFVFTFFSALYNDSDNIIVSMVVNGLYGENNICQYLHPFLCLMIKPFSKVFTHTDVFLLLIHAMTVVEIFMLFYVGVSRWYGKTERDIEDHLQLAMNLFFVFFLSMGVNMWNANYTVQTASFIFTGLFLLLTGSSKSHKVIGSMLTVFGFLLRVEGALLFIPYLFLELLIICIEADKKCIKELFRRILPCTIIITLILTGRFVFYSFEPYKTATLYNESRTTAVDFPMQDWGSIDPKPEGIDRTDYIAATGWVFADTEYINADSLKAMAVAGRRTAFKLNAMDKIIKEMWRRLTQTNLYMLLLFVLTVTYTIRNLVCCGNLRRVESVLAAAGGFVILLYFTCSGRAPTRVWIPVLLAADMVLMIADFKDKKLSRVSPVFSLALCAILWFGIGQAAINFHFHSPTTALNSITSYEVTDNPYTYAKGDELFIWPNWHSASLPAYYCSIGKLPTKDVIEHNIPDGDWVYGQPYYNEMLKRINAVNPARALLEREDTYLMEGYSETLISQMKEHYGNDIEVIEAGEAAGKKIYKVVHGK